MTAQLGPKGPAFGLEKAIEYVKRIYEKEPHNVMASEAAAQHMGYNGLNGASQRTIATLRRYGLLEGRGEQIKVSENALTILADEHSEDQSERAEALSECLKSVPLFSQLQSQFTGVPAGNTLIPFLLKQRMKRDTAKAMATAYRKSVEFVNQAAKNCSPTQPGVDAEITEGAVELQTQNPESRDVHIPLAAGSWATLNADFPLSESAWSQMMSVLNAMKPALVAEKEESESS